MMQEIHLAPEARRKAADYSSCAGMGFSKSVPLPYFSGGLFNPLCELVVLPVSAPSVVVAYCHVVNNALLKHTYVLYHIKIIST